MPEKRFDAIVVGSGATGGFAAKELTERGLRVLLLEAGRILTDKEYEPLEAGQQAKAISPVDRVVAGIKGQYMQARASFLSKENAFLFVNDWKNPYTYSSGNPYLWIRGKHLGGRFLNWGRVMMRMSDYDFKGASKDGIGENWPICYNDLIPYYEHVEKFLGVIGQENGVPNIPDGKYIQTARLTTCEEAFKKKVESTWPERKVIAWRYMSANAIKNHTPITILAAKATGLLEIRANAPVKRILVDPVSGRATGVEYIDGATKQSVNAFADVVMLCASTIETVRLMLNSASSRFPNGVGNSSGALGHYFMDQSPCMVFGTVPGSEGWEIGDEGHSDATNPNSGGIYFPRFENLDNVTNPEFARGYNIQGAIQRHLPPPGVPALFGFMGQGEMLPRYENTITISSWRKDAWGIPAPHLNISMGENEKKMVHSMVATIKDMVLSAGFEIDIAASSLGLAAPLLPHDTWFSRTMFRMSYKISLGLGAAIHECGGARMGEDPSKSIVNPFNQVWEVPNLYITDSSCFVSNGTCGPTLTTMALTVRACERIAKELGKV